MDVEEELPSLQSVLSELSARLAPAGRQEALCECWVRVLAGLELDLDSLLEEGAGDERLAELRASGHEVLALELGKWCRNKRAMRPFEPTMRQQRDKRRPRSKSSTCSRMRTGRQNGAPGRAHQLLQRQSRLWRFSPWIRTQETSLRDRGNLSRPVHLFDAIRSILLLIFGAGPTPPIIPHGASGRAVRNFSWFDEIWLFVGATKLHHAAACPPNENVGNELQTSVCSLDRDQLFRSANQLCPRVRLVS
jgi:hypothetical protein